MSSDKLSLEELLTSANKLKMYPDFIDPTPEFCVIRRLVKRSYGDVYDSFGWRFNEIGNVLVVTVNRCGRRRLLEYPTVEFNRLVALEEVGI